MNFRNLLAALLLIPVLAVGQITPKLRVDALPSSAGINSTDLTIDDQYGTTRSATFAQVLAWVNPLITGSSALNTVGTIIAGTWNGTVLSSTYGGLGVANFTGIPFGNGASSASPATAAQIAAVFTGTHDIAHCLAGDGSMQPCSGAGAGPGGTSGQIQFNNAGVFGGVTSVPVANGGTGQATANNALNALLPSQSGVTSGWVLQTDGTNTSWAAGGSSSGGSGTVGSGTTGQLAAYPGAGTAVGGQSVVTPAQGGTGVNNSTHTLTVAQNSTFTSATGNIGTLELLQNSQSGNYTTVLADSGKHVYHASTSPHTWTIPTNASLAYPIGTTLTFVNEDGGGIVTITTADTLIFSPGGSKTNRSLAADGFATALKIGTTTWIISGAGLS